MSKLNRRTELTLAIIALVLGGAVALWNPIFAIVSVALGIFLVVHQHRSVGPVAVDFVEEDWVPEEGGYEFVVPRSRHGRRTPNASVHQATVAGGFREVFCDVETGANGDVRVHISVDPIRGQVRIP